MANITLSTLGALETEPGALFVRLVNPTEFDKATEAIRNRLKQEYNWDLINPELWGLIGFSGGPIKKWLTLYIKESNQLRKPYFKSDLSQWENIFINTYGYSKEKTETYLRVLRQLADEGVISDIIYRPYTYDPKDDVETGEVIWVESKKMLYTTTAMLIAGGVGYLLLKGYLFNVKKNSKRT